MLVIITQDFLRRCLNYTELRQLIKRKWRFHWRVEELSEVRSDSSAASVVYMRIVSDLSSTFVCLLNRNIKSFSVILMCVHCLFNRMFRVSEPFAVRCKPVCPLETRSMELDIAYWSWNHFPSSSAPPQSFSLRSKGFPRYFGEL